jgi:hypothetical protein
VIAREGVVEEGGLESGQIEAFGEGACLVGRQLDQVLAQS